jgi:hypothetical protein
MEWLTLGTALFAAGIAIWQARTQRVRQVEDVYVTRYWSLLDKMSPETLRGRDTPAQDPQGSMSEEEKAIRLYFRLSEDEADLRAQGWVSDDTWQEWRGAIHSQMQRAPFNRLWAEALEDSDARHDYAFTHLRKLCRDADYDPPATKRIRRLSRRIPGRTTAARPQR